MHTLTFFDIDGTLFHTTACIRVINQAGDSRALTNQEFNHHTLQPGEVFDFTEFRSAEKFRKESIPVAHIIDRLKDALNRHEDVRLLTAREDLDNKDTFLDTFRDVGIDIDRTHIHRSGNLKLDLSVADKKMIWVRRYIENNNYTCIKLYDDSIYNIHALKALEKDYPHIKFVGIYVLEDGTEQEY